MSIIPKFLTNQIAANEIIISMTPYCPTPQHLLHMQKKGEFPKFEDFSWIKMSWVLITLRRITVMWDDAQVSERWAIDERK